MAQVDSVFSHGPHKGKSVELFGESLLGDKYTVVHGGNNEHSEYSMDHFMLVPS